MSGCLIRESWSLGAASVGSELPETELQALFATMSKTIFALLQRTSSKLLGRPEQTWTGIVEPYSRVLLPLWPSLAETQDGV